MRVYLNVARDVDVEEEEVFRRHKLGGWWMAGPTKGDKKGEIRSGYITMARS